MENGSVPMTNPLYTAENCRAAYQLNWSVSVFWRQAAPWEAGWLEALKQATETDGIRVLEHHFRQADLSQFLVSTRPDIAPAQILQRLKGRLQYLVREQFPKALRRNYSIHSVGSANLASVEAYVSSQLDHHSMADPRIQKRLEQYQIHRADVDLSLPQRSSHGEYRYNLHIVLVHEERWNEVRDAVLSAIQRMILTASQAKQHRLSRAGILADHVHLLLGCNLVESPLEVALGYLNNLAYAQGMHRVYQYGFYVGTVGEYDLGAIRRNL
jgi:REP element-mobilizing transposase RayT